VILQPGFLKMSARNGGIEQTKMPTTIHDHIDRRRPVGDAGRRKEAEDQAEHGAKNPHTSDEPHPEVLAARNPVWAFRSGL